MFIQISCDNFEKEESIKERDYYQSIFNTDITFSQRQVDSTHLGFYCDEGFSTTKHFLVLFPNSIYKYKSNGCFASAIDSGFYELDKTNIVFNSVCSEKQQEDEMFFPIISKLNYGTYRENTLILPGDKGGKYFKVKASEKNNLCNQQ